MRSLASQAEVRADSELLRTAYKTAVTIMGREHAQIRLGCLRLYQYLFMRSALFRELAVLDFQTMVELCIGVDDVSKPLPPPKRFARDLRTEALKFVQGAHAKFGTDYKQISLAYNFLRRRHKVDFEATQEASRAEQEAADQRAAAISELMPRCPCSPIRRTHDGTRQPTSTRRLAHEFGQNFSDGGPSSNGRSPS